MITNILGWLIIIFPIPFIVWLILDGVKTKRLNQQNCDQSTGKQKEMNALLFQAVDEGDVEELKKAIADGADVNVRGFGGKTSLIRIAHRAMDKEHGNDQSNLLIAKILVEKGADVNVKDLFNKSAIEYLDRDASGTADQIAVFLKEKGARDFARCSSNEPSS